MQSPFCIMNKTNIIVVKFRYLLTFCRQITCCPKCFKPKSIELYAFCPFGLADRKNPRLCTVYSLLATFLTCQVRTPTHTHTQNNTNTVTHTHTYTHTVTTQYVHIQKRTDPHTNKRQCRRLSELPFRQPKRNLCM